ncbi:MAG TPA: YciI family protein [Streptosporangiaceae bacterium]|nr:YciI family protein [Streptosporangiaceae bacterium]
MRSGDVLVAGGPFADDLGGRARRDTQPAETKEQIGGYDVIECADLDEATGIAAGHPTARIGTIEVRPLLDQ